MRFQLQFGQMVNDSFLSYTDYHVNLIIFVLQITFISLGTVKQNIQYNTVLTIKSRITCINIEQAHKGCSCGKICKNENGLKIHRKKMGCSVAKILERCKGPSDEMNQKTQHSVQHLHVQ